MHHNNSEEFLAVDVGEVKVGLARGSSLARLAEPIKSISAKGAMDEIEIISKQNGVSGIVVGLPRSLDGKETQQTKTIRDWAKVAQTKIELPFYWQDEALTSKDAALLQHQFKNSADEHAIAAAIFLQDFLNTPISERIRV